MDECLQQQERELQEQHYVEMADESMAREELLVTISDLEDRLLYSAERKQGAQVSVSTQCDSRKMEKEVARWAHPSYMEVQYMALEEENKVLEETIQMMSQILREVEDELSIAELN